MRSKAQQPTANTGTQYKRLVPAGLLLLVLGSAGWGWLSFWVPAEQTKAATQTAQAAAARQSGLFNQYIKGLQQQLASFSNRDKVLKQLNISAGRHWRIDATPQLRAAQKEGLQQIDGAAAVLIIPLSTRGTVDPYNSLLLGLTAIELDLLRRCEDPPPLIAEAIRIEKKWLLSMVQCAGAGAVVLHFPVQALADQLRSISGGVTQTELVQFFGARESVIARAPLAEHSDINAEAKLAVPHWKLRVYPPSPDAVARERASLLSRFALGCAAVGAALVLIPIVALVRRRRDTTVPEPRGRRRQKKRDHNTDEATDDGVSAENSAAADDNFAQAVAAQTQIHATPIVTPRKKKPAATEPQQDVRAEPEETIADIFRAYDIRGVADRFMSDQFCFDAGRALGSLLSERGDNALLLGRDGRLSSPRIHEHFLRGLLASGCQVTDLGIVPTPMVHFAAFILGIGNLAVITGSHSAAEYNGIKMSVDFLPLRSEEIKGLHERIVAQQFVEGQGSVSDSDIRQQYIDYICSDISLRDGFKVVIDASNGATSEVGPHLFRALGCDVVQINCTIDGNFPGHPPDPSVAVNLHQLSGAVLEHSADLGIAFDGDGDRVVAVTGTGDPVPADALLMLLARDICRRNKGAKVIYDVKCSVLVKDVVEECGGEPILWKSGHSHMKLKMAETEAQIGGELSGHIFYRERWFGFDDGMYAAARLLEIVSQENIPLDKLVAALPRWHSTPELLIPSNDQRKFDIVAEATSRANFNEAKVIDIDGIRVEYDNRWGLLRASNTGPAISLRFQGSDADALNRIRDEFIELLEDIEPAVALQLAEP